MHRLIPGVLVTAIISVAGFGAYALGSAPAPIARTVAAAPAKSPTPSQRAQPGQPVVFDGKVMPAQSAALSFSTGGTVAEILVAEGANVQAGQLLLRLDHSAQSIQLDRARAQQAAADANLKLLMDGPRPEDIATTEAGVRQSEAQLRQVLGSVTKEDIAATEAQLRAAHTTLDRLLAGDQNADLRAVQAQLQQAQSALATQRGQLSASKTSAELQLNQAAERLIQTQTSYAQARREWERVGGRADGSDATTELSPDKSLNREQQAARDALTRAESELHVAEDAVKQAQVAYDSARKSEIGGLDTAAQSVAGAQAGLDKTRGSIQGEDLAQTQAQLASAQASLLRLSGPQRDQAIAVARASLDITQANLARLKAPPQAGQIMASQAQVDGAKADLAAAQAQLAQTELRAPFAGTIAAIVPKPNEFVGGGIPVVQLSGTAAWQIEAEGLDDLTVVLVHEGDRATISVYALPDLKLTGKVIQIKPSGAGDTGAAAYTVVIALDSVDARLRWNMPAQVSVLASK